MLRNRKCHMPIRHCEKPEEPSSVTYFVPTFYGLTHVSGEEKLEYQKPNDRWKELFKGYKMGSTTIFYLYWVTSYAHSKVSLVPSILPYLPLSPLLASVSST